MRRKLISRGWVQTMMMIVSLLVAAAALGIAVRVVWEIVIALACAFGGWGETMVRIWYDPDTNEFGMDSGGLSAMELAQAGAMIVNGMAAKARSEHGEAAAEAMLMLIRNADDAAVFGLEAVRGVCDGR